MKKEVNLMICAYCDNEFELENNDYIELADGRIFCEDCVQNTESCDRCENVYQDTDEEMSTVIDINETWCSSCIESHAYCCDCCGENVKNEVYRDYNNTLCHDCFSENYCICAGCDTLTHQDYANYNRDGEAYCECCFEANESEYIKDYNYRQSLNFLSCNDEHENYKAYLGFEIEAGGMDSQSEVNDIARDLCENYNSDDTFLLKYDGSIPDCGFELVSQPATLKKHKTLNWESILKTMSSAGLRSHDVNDCGLHIHVSKNFLTDNQWLLCDWLVSKCQSQFETIARRKENSWAKFKKSNGKPITEVFGKKTGNRYQAVNFENNATVEFRLFRGTLNYTTFLATLEIVDALVKWAKQAGINSVLMSKNEFKEYTNYILKNRELYENAVNYLKEKNLI